MTVPCNVQSWSPETSKSYTLRYCAGDRSPRSWSQRTGLVKPGSSFKTVRWRVSFKSQSNMFLAADILASQGSLSSFQSRSSEDTFTSEVLHGKRSHDQSPHRQLGPLGLQHQCKSLSRSCVPCERRASSWRSPSREPDKEFSEMKLLQITEVRRPVQSKESGEASGSKACESLLKKEKAPPENYSGEG